MFSGIWRKAKKKNMKKERKFGLKEFPRPLNTTKGGTQMEECMFIKADEIRQLLGISRSKAYQIIRELNAELKSQGYMVVNGVVRQIRCTSPMQISCV